MPIAWHLPTPTHPVPFPSVLSLGVHGRLTDLGKVTQRAYNLALSVAMGREIDAVVVDNERTARDCIQYLKEQQIAPITFIPLATCKVRSALSSQQPC